MVKRVIWTESALTDLEDTSEFIAKDSPRYAASFVQEVIEKSFTLKELFDHGRKVPDFDHANVREIFIKAYRLIYLSQLMKFKL